MGIRRRLGFGVTVVASLAILIVPSFAQAQAWLDDRARTEGPGFRLGDFELHPGLGIEVGYDSNVFYSDDDATSLPRLDSGILRATAHVLIATRGPQRREEGESGEGGGSEAQPVATFRGGLSGSFYYYFADDSRTNMELDASLALGILPGRPFSIQISEMFGRSIRPFTENTPRAAFGADLLSYARIQNDAGLRFNFSTAGELLRVGVGYNFVLDFFEDSFFQYGNNFRHVIAVEEQFRFLPQTAIVHDTTLTILDYFGGAAGAITPPTAVNDGILIRTRVGLNGAITNEFSILGMVGYSAGFYSTAVAGYDQEFESIAAQIEARWQISRAVRLAFGYDRDFRPSFIGNFYRQDRGYANFQALIDRQFLLGIDASFGYYEFGAIVRPGGTDPLGEGGYSRGDFRLSAGLFGEYRFTDWLGVNATARYTGNFTDYVYMIAAGAGELRDPASYHKIELWLGVRAFY